MEPFIAAAAVELGPEGDPAALASRVERMVAPVLPGAEVTDVGHAAGGVRFAVNLPRFHDRTWDMPRALVVNHAANLTWLVSTVAGGIGG